MNTFETPQPIAVTLELAVGDIHIEASDRTDTVVDIRPSDSSKKSDVIAARDTRVEYASGRLLIRTPKNWKQYTFWSGRESVDVHIDIPSGSQVNGETAVGSLRATGRLGDCTFTTSAGDIAISRAGALRLKTSVGDVTIEEAIGQAEVTTRSGAVRIDSIDGAGVVKNSNGNTWVGHVTGDLRATSANGNIAVDQARAGVVAKTANGNVRLDEVTRGAIVAETSQGRVEIGVVEGVAAWLDVKTQYGLVTNNLDSVAQPGTGDETVEVRARTAFGDITISRSLASQTKPSSK